MDSLQYSPQIYLLTQGIEIAAEAAGMGYQVQREPVYVRVLVAPEGDQWVAQSVDHTLAAQGGSDHDAVAAFVRVFWAHYRRDIQLGRTPFATLPNPPAQLEERWNQLVDQKRSRIVAAPDGTELPPAYILEAIARKSTPAASGC